MKARDHDKIMREHKQSVAALYRRQYMELEHIKQFYVGEVADRERIMDNYADALSRQDAEIAILTQMLVRLGVDTETIDRRVGEELAKLNENEVKP